MTHRYDFRRITATAALALTMALGAGAALAQPMGGPHGPGAPDEMIGRLIAHAQAQLNLNSMQQQMFSTAVADSKKLHASTQAVRQKVRDVLKEQLAKPEPNLAAVAAAADAAIDEARLLRKPVRDEWLQLYATFTPEQKAVVRDLMQKRMARADSFRQRMIERMQQHMDGTNG
jgi:Spy/CpxP family protein refolding chaperone